MAWQLQFLSVDRRATDFNTPDCYMKITDTKIAGIKIIEPRVFGDSRGFFLESWNKKAFRDAGLPTEFVQDNHSRSAQGVLRGLHYQVKQPQGKLVRVTSGEVFDVAVDIKPSSPTYGEWVGVHLSAENHRLFWVPPGFAHGFYVLSETCLLYTSPSPRDATLSRMPSSA